MSTEPLQIKADNWHLRIYLLINENKPPESVREYCFVWFLFCALGVMIAVIVLFLGLLLAAATSPVLHHYWPDNSIVTYLRGRPWEMDVQVFRFWAIVLPVGSILYWMRHGLRRGWKKIIRWVENVQIPPSRPIEIIESKGNENDQ